MALCRLSCVAFCLLQAGLVNADITQTPKFQIWKTGQKVTLKCTQDMSHTYMCWYRQDLGEGMRLIHYSVGIGATEKGDVSEGYSVTRSKTGDFPLTLESATPSQTSVYFCASSVSTALYSCLLSAQKGKKRPCTMDLGGPYANSTLWSPQWPEPAVCGEIHLQESVCRA